MSSETNNLESVKAPRQVAPHNPDISSSNVDGDKPVKRLPPIKAPVGLAPGPDLRNCKSKVGSFNNIKHTAAGGSVTIPNQKLAWNAKSKVGSLDNKEHKPAGGQLKIESRKLQWNTTSKVQSLANVKHKPGGGNVKIFNESYRSKAKESRTDERSESKSPQTSLSRDLMQLKLSDK